MLTYQDLKRKQSACVAEARKIQEAADKADRPITAEEQTQIDAHLAKSAEWGRSADAMLKVDGAQVEAQKPTPTTMPETLEGISGAVPRTVPAEARDLKEEAKAGFAHLGDFAASVYNAHPQVHSGFDPRLQKMATMNQATGSEGGFLVPAAFSQQIYDRFSGQADSLLARTDQYTLGQEESITFPVDAETSRADGSRAGGIRGYWKGEQTQMSATNPTVKEFRLEPQELYVYAKVTDKLLRNSPLALDQYLTRKAGDEIAFKVGDAIINGTGAGMPLGILTSPCAISITKETGQAAATVLVENVVKMWARLHPKSKPNAVWFENGEVEQQLQVLTLGVGLGGQLVYMPAGGITQAPYGSIFGRPVIPVEYCAALGTAGDLILADLSAYATAVRGGVRSDMSIHLLFDYNITAFRFLFEADGKPWLSTAITPYKATSGKTLSPFVYLGARA